MADTKGSFTSRLFGSLFGRSNQQNSSVYDIDMDEEDSTVSKVEKDCRTKTQKAPGVSSQSSRFSFNRFEQSIKEKLTRQIELETMQKFQEHRIALQKYRAILDKWQNDLNEREERLLEEVRVEKEEFLQTRNAALAEIAKEKSVLDEAREVFNSAVFRADSGTMEWIHRVDKKERKAIDEIRDKVTLMEEYSQKFPRDGSQFEVEVANIMNANGFENVEVTKHSNDFGADITAEKDGIKYVVQCKNYSSAVGVDAVQEIYAAKVHYRAHIAIVAANSVFTKAATILAQESGVLLWDCEKLESMRKN